MSGPHNPTLKQLENDWLDYIESLDITSSHRALITACKDVLTWLRPEYPITYLDGDAVVMAWSTRQFFVDIDVYPDHVKWFYNDRISGAVSSGSVPQTSIWSEKWFPC